jgi:hypothetical protein
VKGNWGDGVGEQLAMPMTATTKSSFKVIECICVVKCQVASYRLEWSPAIEMESIRFEFIYVARHLVCARRDEGKISVLISKKMSQEMKLSNIDSEVKTVLRKRARVVALL